MAKALKESLPVATVNLFQSEHWKEALCSYLPESKGVKTPTAKEISSNNWFIKPFVVNSPRKVGGLQHIGLECFRAYIVCCLAVLGVRVGGGCGGE